MNTASEATSADGDARSSREIENDIRRTRGRMDATLDELGDRLSARSLLNSALDWWEQRPATTQGAASAKFKDASRVVSRQVKDHPGPALLIGAGIAWLIMDAAKNDDADVSYRSSIAPGGDDYRGYGSQPAGQWSRGAAFSEGTSSYASGGIGDGQESDASGGIADKVKGVAGQAKDALAGAAGAVREKASAMGGAAHGTLDEARRRANDLQSQGRSATRQIGNGIQSGYRSGTQQFTEAVEQYPLAVGVGFAALGALVGLLLPRTQGEDQLMGRQSDQLTETVKQAGQETLERGKAVAQRVAEKAASEAQNQGLTGETAAGGVSGLASKAGEILSAVKEEAAAAAKEENLIPEPLAKTTRSGSEVSSTQQQGGA